jgi:hypothetical protein
MTDSVVPPDSTPPDFVNAAPAGETPKVVVAVPFMTFTGIDSVLNPVPLMTTCPTDPTGRTVGSMLTRIVFGAIVVGEFNTVAVTPGVVETLKTADDCPVFSSVILISFGVTIVATSKVSPAGLATNLACAKRPGALAATSITTPARRPKA